jgi:hypothetical protein
MIEFGHQNGTAIILRLLLADVREGQNRPADVARFVQQGRTAEAADHWLCFFAELEAKLLVLERLTAKKTRNRGGLRGDGGSIATRKSPLGRQYVERWDMRRPERG